MINKKRNNRAALARSFKMLNWKVHVKEYESFFSSVCLKAKEEDFFENLYVSREEDNHQIQLFAGQHPIGFGETKRDISGRVISRKLESERGAGIVISQSELGDVIVVLYPYKSANVTQNQSHIIWGVFSDPRLITHTVLKSVTEDFFKYIRVSSAVMSESTWDRLRIRYLELRSRKYTGGSNFFQMVFSHWFWIFFGAIGTVASLYSLTK